MEFGALHCKPQKPSCQTCPLLLGCVAKQKGLVDSIPTKKAKAGVRQRFFLYLVVNQCNMKEDQFLFNKRTAKDIWTNLYDFPLIEHTAPFTYDDIIAALASVPFLKAMPYNIINVSANYKHQLTHQTINAQFCRIQLLHPKLTVVKPYFVVNQSKIKELAIPRLVERYLLDEGIL